MPERSRPTGCALHCTQLQSVHGQASVVRAQHQAPRVSHAWPTPAPVDPRERVALKFGAHKFNLRQAGDPSGETCEADAPASLDLCIITKGSLQSVVTRLNDSRMPITVGPVPRMGVLGPMTPICCEDPELVAVATYASITIG
jgi:hypothetical protein